MMKSIVDRMRRNSERGQAIILIAAAMVGLVAIIGLMIDGGILLIEYARLKRAIDSASIAASSQFRKGFEGDALQLAGEEFLRLNQSDSVVTIFTCSCPPDDPTNCAAHGWHLDASLCPANTGGVARKLVRVTAVRQVKFGFMQVVGFKETTISATSIGEAAALDLVLVMDTSSSMSYDTKDGGTDFADAATATDPGDDPGVCNDHMNDGPHATDPDNLQRCEPLGTVKDVAVQFIEGPLLFFPYDRVSLVALTEQNVGGNRNPVVTLHWSDNYTGSTYDFEIQNRIRDLRVFQPVVCETPAAMNSLGGCIRYIDGLYQTTGCDRTGESGPTTCASSNIGGGLYAAGREFDTARQESFWAVITLFSGPATATSPILPAAPLGFCPMSTWDPANGRGCRDYDTPSINGGFDPATFDMIADSTRHSIINIPPNPPTYPADYDADDFARDQADFVASPSIGQGATIYSICMGNLCRGTDPNRADPYSGEHLGQYMALHAGGADANHGIYQFSSDAAGLAAVFAKISENIFTRISQ